MPTRSLRRSRPGTCVTSRLAWYSVQHALAWAPARKRHAAATKGYVYLQLVVRSIFSPFSVFSCRLHIFSFASSLSRSLAIELADRLSASPVLLAVGPESVSRRLAQSTESLEQWTLHTTRGVNMEMIKISWRVIYSRVKLWWIVYTTLAGCSANKSQIRFCYLRHSRFISLSRFASSLGLLLSQKHAISSSSSLSRYSRMYIHRCTYEMTVETCPAWRLLNDVERIGKVDRLKSIMLGNYREKS